MSETLSELTDSVHKPIKCSICGIEFERKTPIVRRGHPSNYGYYHEGCWKALGTDNIGKCSHYTPAEDSSKWAFAHRTWGCPDEGAVWPHGYEELAMHD